ncbi:hypothetical protein ACWCXB_08780 [Streptomyces sp. NPDC001514]
MSKPVLVSRRRWLLLSGLVAVGGGIGIYAAADEGVPARERVRTDVEPLRSRFRHIGHLTDPHWLVDNPNDSGRDIPDQDPQIRVVGFARLPAGTAGKITGVPAYGFAARDPREVPEPLAEFRPAEARWMSSARYDQRITKALYSGRFHLDPVTDSLYFDTFNPATV